MVCLSAVLAIHVGVVCFLLPPSLHAETIPLLRSGRQWLGEMAGRSDCSFPISTTDRRTTGNNATGSTSPANSVSLCNFQLSSPKVDGVYSWQKGLASLSTWLGGPSKDASNSSDGGYVFFETSSLSVQQLPGVQAKAWLKSPVYEPTSPNGHCLRFSYNIQGVSASELKLLRVQLLPLEGHRPAAPSSASTASSSPLMVNSILLPTVPSQLRIPEGAFASPWTPFHAIIMNDTSGWREVVDEVWLSSDTTRGDWHVGHVTYSSPYPHAFVFEAVPNLARLQYRGYIAVDDVQFDVGPCQAECEFNSDFCQWANDKTGQDDFDWSLSRGSLWTHTGPIRDELSSRNNWNFGGYAYIDSREPHFAGSKTSLSSPVLPATTNALCFSFWVHMFGAGIGHLRVLQKEAAATTSNSSETPLEIWRLSESGPRDTWYRAQVTAASPRPFQIQVEATVGESGYGDIAVDSFRLERGACPGLPEHAVSKGTDCTFQTDLCGWVVTNSQPGITSMWSLTNGDIFAGRPDGHIQQNVLGQPINNYMSFDVYQNGHRAGSRGFVSSQLLPSPSPQCLSFWVYMASAVPSQPRLGALEVVLFEPNATDSNSSSSSSNSSTKYTSVKSTILWRLENHQEEKWLFGQVPLTAPNGGYVSFVGIRGEGVRGILAVDDVTLYRSDCPSQPIDAVVSALDCSFDLNFCGWTVASRRPDNEIDPVSVNETAIITTTAATTLSPPPTTDAAIVATLVSRSNLQPDSIKAATDETAVRFPDDDIDQDMSDLSMSTGTVAVTPITTEFWTQPTTSYTTEGDALLLSTPSPEVATTEDSNTEPPTSTEPPTTPSTTTATLDVQTSTILSTDPTTLPLRTTTESVSSSTANITSASELTTSPVVAMTTENVTSKDQRRVSGLYDEVTSFGLNTIEVISTSRHGGTKSIIISQPGRIWSNNRRRRSRRSESGWVGYNWPSRKQRILSGRNNAHHRHDQSESNDASWQRPRPVPLWLRNNRPAATGHGHAEDGRSEINTHSIASFRHPHHPSTTAPPTTQPKLYAVSYHATSRPLRPSHSVNNPIKSQLPAAVNAEPARWILATDKASLYPIRDHTFQLSEGGYVFLGGTEIGRESSVSRLLSPPFFTGNSTQCLSFHFAMVYNDPNTTLIVYRQSGNEGALQELWRVTSAALERTSPGIRYKSPWIPARVPILPIDETHQQTIITIEGTSSGGGIALDDLRLKSVSCAIRP